MLGIRCWLPVLLITSIPGPAALAAGPASLELVCLDNQVIYYASFQSHNQKVVANDRGIFVAYVKSRNRDYTAQGWRVLRSRDGGRTFTLFASGVAATHPPVLETDAEGNLYLGRVDFVSGKAHIERYLATEDLRQPHVTDLPGGAAGKYAMAIDARRKALVFFSHNNEFYRIGLEGTLRSRMTLLKAGRRAVLQYPSVGFDERGDLYAAWTTVPPDRYLYHDIHLMRSRDGGLTWETLTGQPLTPPIVADDSGPTQRITRDDEFDVHTWLCNLLAGRGKLHLMYLTQSKPSRFNYVRFDLMSGHEDLRITPAFRGETLTLSGLDGSFSSRLFDPAAPLVAVSRDARRPRLAALRSDDRGTTWHDLAVGPDLTNPYAISGCRELTSDGQAIGVFTDVVEANDHPTGRSKLYFYRIPVGASRVP